MMEMKNHTEEIENKQTVKTKYSKKEDKMQQHLEWKENLKQYIFVIRELTGREIKRKYARSFLGVIWSVLNPLLHMLVMSLIFSTMFRRNIENFPLYYLTGSLFWSFFSGTTNTTMTCLVDNRAMLIKVKFPRQVFALSRVYTAVVNLGYSCIAYVVMLGIFRIRPNVRMLLFPVVFLFALLFATGIGYLLSIIYAFFADIKYLYSVVLTLWMYLCALFYPVDLLPDFLQSVLKVNPVYVQIHIARDLMLYNKISELSWWIELFGFGVVSFLTGYLVFQKNQDRLMQVL